jgi:hypothetical protein
MCNLKSQYQDLADKKSSKQTMRVHPAAPARVLQPGVIQMVEWKHHGEDQGEESAGEWGQVCGGTAPGCCRSVEDSCALAGASSDHAVVEKVTAGDWGSPAIVL